MTSTRRSSHDNDVIPAKAGIQFWDTPDALVAKEAAPDNLAKDRGRPVSLTKVGTSQGLSLVGCRGGKSTASGRVRPRCSALAADAGGDVAAADAHVGEEAVVEGPHATDFPVKFHAFAQPFRDFVQHFSLLFGRGCSRGAPEGVRTRLQSVA
jgi:hypothetical protein